MNSKFLNTSFVLALLCGEHSFAMNNPVDGPRRTMFTRQEVHNNRHVTFSLGETQNDHHQMGFFQQEVLPKVSDVYDESILDLTDMSAEKLSQYGSFYNVRKLKISTEYLRKHKIEPFFKLSALPLQQLQSLEIVGNIGEGREIRKNLADLLSQTSKLKELNLSGNKLKTLPESIYKLRELEELDLSKNPQLTKLPKALWRSPRLQKVTINSALISANQVPEYIELLKNEELIALLSSYKNKRGLNSNQIEFMKNNLRSCKTITICGCHWNDETHVWDKSSSKNSTKIVKLKNMSVAEALIYYIKGKEHWNAAEKLINYGVNISAADANSQDKYGIPLLVKAAEGGRLKIVKYLIEHGASMQVRTKFANTALMGAALFGYLDIAKYLVGHGANVNDQNIGGETALMRAAGQRHLKIVKYLLENGADINAQDRFGDTALMKGAYYGSLKIVKYLIENGADVNARDDSKSTVLMRSVLEGQLGIIKYLINRGANVNDQNKHGETALMKAVKEEQTRVVKCLAENGADVNVVDENGMTALHFAQERLEKAPDEDKPKYQDLIEFLENHRDNPSTSKKSL